MLTETFMLTYGDGLSNINIKKLYNFHKKNKKKLLLQQFIHLLGLENWKLKEILYNHLRKNHNFKEVG